MKTSSTLLSLAASILLLPSLSLASGKTMGSSEEIKGAIHYVASPLYFLGLKPEDYSYVRRTALMRRIVELSGKGNLGRSLDWARAHADKDPQARYLYALHARHGLAMEQSYSTMLEQLQQAAEQNHAASIHELADVYLRGDGVEKDSKKALELLHRAAALGSNEARCKRASILREMGFDQEATQLYLEAAKAELPDALYALGIAYANGLGIEKDEAKAFALIEQASKKDHIGALAALRTLYQLGLGCTASPAKVEELNLQLATLLVYDSEIKSKNTAFCTASLIANRLVSSEKDGVTVLQNKAAEGDTQAQLALASAYISGYGVEKDARKAVEIYLRCHEAGSSYGTLMAGAILMYSHPQKAEALLRAAAEAGEAYAIALLARAHLYPEHNPFEFEYDESKAYELYRKSAAMGDMHSEFLLGIMLFNGMGCDKDVKEAREWFAKAAAKNHPHALTVLAKYERFDFLKEGSSALEEREKRALPYYLKAAQCGDDHAQYQMAFFVFNKSHEESVYWLELAAELGNEPAMEQLADAYRRGHGVTKDIPKALRLYEKLAPRGRQAASLSLAHIYERGADGVPRDAKKALRWYKAAHRARLPQTGKIADLLLCHEVVEEQNPALAYQMLEEQLNGLVETHYDQFLQLEQLLKLKDARFPRLSGRELKLCEQRARAGDAMAQHQLAVYHLRGESGKVDAKKAYELLLAAEKGGSPEVLLDLALYHHKGIAAAVDHAKAMSGYDKAIAAAPSEAKILFFASLFHRQYQNYGSILRGWGKEYLQEAVEKGYADAIFFQNLKLSAFLRRDAEAQKALCAIADAGHFAAQFVLMRALTGHDAPKDAATAKLTMKYTLMIAEQGYAHAQFLMGVSYQMGVAALELAPDLEKAIYWFTQAAEQGHTWSKNRLKKLQKK